VVHHNILTRWRGFGAVKTPPPRAPGQSGGSLRRASSRGTPGELRVLAHAAAAEQGRARRRSFDEGLRKEGASRRPPLVESAGWSAGQHRGVALVGACPSGAARSTARSQAGLLTVFAHVHECMSHRALQDDSGGSLRRAASRGTPGEIRALAHAATGEQGRARPRSSGGARRHGGERGALAHAAAGDRRGGRLSCHAGVVVGRQSVRRSRRPFTSAGSGGRGALEARGGSTGGLRVGRGRDAGGQPRRATA